MTPQADEEEFVAKPPRTDRVRIRGWERLPGIQSILSLTTIVCYYTVDRQTLGKTGITGIRRFPAHGHRPDEGHRREGPDWVPQGNQFCLALAVPPRWSRRRLSFLA